MPSRTRRPPVRTQRLVRVRGRTLRPSSPQELPPAAPAPAPVWLLAPSDVARRANTAPHPRAKTPLKRDWIGSLDISAPMARGASTIDRENTTAIAVAVETLGG